MTQLRTTETESDMKDCAKSIQVVLLMATCTVAWAQTCRDDIPSTAPDGRFTGDGDGTITDRATGMIWRQCSEGLSGTGCADGSAAYYSWPEALRVAADADYLGHTDWRLPNKNELESLIERRCSGPAINSGYFPNTPSHWYWSSSPSGRYQSQAWAVDFGSGGVADLWMNEGGHVRLVRGGQ